MTEEECIKARAQVLALPTTKRVLLTAYGTRYVVMMTYPYHAFARDSDGCDIFTTFDETEAREFCWEAQKASDACDFAVFKLERLTDAL